LYYNIRQSEIECYTDKFCPTFLGLRTASHFGNISLKAYIYIYIEMEMEGNKLKIERKRFDKGINQ
jgi:hypothetical protein